MKFIVVIIYYELFIFRGENYDKEKLWVNAHVNFIYDNVHWKRTNSIVSRVDINIKKIYYINDTEDGF